MNEVVQEILRRLEERRSLYREPNPLVLMTDMDFIHMMRVKLLRVQYGVVPEKRYDDLGDLLAYGLWLMRRWTPKEVKSDKGDKVQVSGDEVY